MGTLFVLVGLAIIGLAVHTHLRARRQADAATAWPTAVGRITESRVEDSIETSGEGDAETVWFARVAYAYSINGQRLTGTRIGYGVPTRHDTEAAARALAARFPEGAEIPVRYDPANPAEAVLDATRPSITRPLIYAGVGLLLLLIGSSI